MQQIEIMGKDHLFWNKKYLDLFDMKAVQTGPFYSEHSEEAIIELIFKKYKPRNQWCVDVGAWGKRSSNTWKLMENLWNTVFVESNIDRLAEIRTQVIEKKNVYLVSEMVTPGKLADLYGENGYIHEPYCLDAILLRLKNIPTDFDFLNIDIDSYEYEVWNYLRHFKPNLICMEVNQFETDFKKIGYDPSFTLNKYMENPNGGGSYGGATVGLVNRLAEEKGYDYLCWDTSNAFYIKRSFIDEYQV